MTTFAVSTVFKGVDQMSPVFAAMGKNAEGFGVTMEGTAKKASERFRGAMNIAATGIGTVGAGLAAGGGYLASKLGLFDLPEQAMNMEYQLRALGNVGGLTKRELTDIQDQILKTARATNKLPQELLSGVQSLVAGGFDPKMAMKFIEPITKAATAEQAGIVDLAQTVQTNFETMGIPIERAQNALDKLALAGKLGKFELRDMAQYFPMLAADAAIMGIKGEKGLTMIAAAAQIARKGTGDASSAATNLDNFLQKMTHPETVGRFKKMGIDILKVKNEALKLGNDPFVAMLEATKKATKGNSDLISTLFTDAQVKKFVAIMMQQLDQYKSIRDQIASGGDTINEDFTNMMDTAQGQWDKFKISVQTTLLPELNPWIKGISETLHDLNENGDPGRIGKTILAVTGLGVALGGIAVGLVSINAALGIMTTIGVVAFSWAAGIAALGIAVGALGIQIYRHWDTISSGVGDSIENLSASASKFWDVLSGKKELEGPKFKNADEEFAALAREREWELNQRWLGGGKVEGNIGIPQSSSADFPVGAPMESTERRELITPETIRKENYEEFVSRVVEKQGKQSIDLRIRTDKGAEVDAEASGGLFNITQSYAPAGAR